MRVAVELECLQNEVFAARLITTDRQGYVLEMVRFWMSEFQPQQPTRYPSTYVVPGCSGVLGQIF